MSPLVFTFVVLVLYLLGLELLGFVALRRGAETTGDYFLSGRSVGLVALTGTTMASLLSTGTVVSNPPNFYKTGTAYFWVIFFGWTLSMVLVFGLRFWKLSQRYGYITPGQLIGDLYGSRRVQLSFGLVGLACVVPYSTAQLVAIGKVFVGLSQGTISYRWGVIIAGVAMFVFLFAGARAVIWTDVVQGFLFTLLLAVAAWLVVGWCGGWEPLVGNLMAHKPEIADYSEVAAWPVIEKTFAIPALFVLPYMLQRMFMASSSRDLVRMTLVTPPLYIVIILSCWVIGTGALTLYPEGLERPDQLLGKLFADHAPYVGALVLVAAFSAGISTVDSQLLTAASLMTKDVRRPRASDTEALEFRLGRLTSLGILVVVTCAALFLQRYNIIDLVLLGIFLSAAFLPAIVCTFFWRRCSEPAVFYSVLAGALGYAVRAWLPGAAGWVEGAGLISWAGGCALVTLVLLSWLSPCRQPDARRFEGV